MVRLQNPDSRYFDEVVFILKDGAAPTGGCDLVAEANRILAENVELKKGGRAHVGARALWLLLGVLGASAAWLPLSLIL